MQIEKKYSYSTLPSFTATSRGTTVAQEHLSSFPTRLALARWTRGGDIPHVHTSERNMPMRAAWYAQAQQHFTAWLGEGGFHKATQLCLDCALREEGRARAAQPASSANADERIAAALPQPGIGSWPGSEVQR